MKRIASLAGAAGLIALLAGCGGNGHDTPQVQVEPLSARAETVSGGDVLVRLRSSDGDRLAAATVQVNGRDVSNAFRPDPDSNGLIGLVTGLSAGANTLTASSAADAAVRGQVTLVNHPVTGPVFSGPHQTPYVCELNSFGLGPALDANCSAATRVDYFYRSTATNTFVALDTAAPRPANVATTTTTEGATVPYIVRREMGTVNRSVYLIAFLHEPGTPLPDPWTRTAGWNGRLLYSFGGGVRAGYHQGRSVGGLSAATSHLEHALYGDYPLARGYAIAAGSQNVFGTNASDLISAETMLMVKERFTEQFGVPRYTIGIGESGGSMQQHTIANNYPGSLDGLLPGRSYPDVMTFLQPLFDCELLTNTLDAPGSTWTQAQKTAASGLASFTYCRSNGTRYPNLRPTNCDPVPLPGPPLVYNAQTNPTGARCTFQDNLVNVYGKDPATGFARRPFDNVGVQYGLDAFNAGTITFAQFADLNARIGGFDIDGNIIPGRMVGNTQALEISYQTGRLNDGTSLAGVPIIDIRSYLDADLADGTSDVHNAYHSRTMRQRLVAANGNAANHVILTTATLGTLALDQSTANGPLRTVHREALDRMDQWLAAIRADTSSRSKAEKVARLKPADLVDACYPAATQKVTDAATCAAMFPYSEDPRMAAGGPVTSDVFKCTLKPVSAADYTAQLSTAQLDTLRTIFPDGVCDWSRPGVGQQARVGTWLTYPR
ncbi:MAG TPA: DUF6351 family protein [Caldimonas sp.]|jgi:hypothetical protein|nr:DUF6351 family protein [Caldimonas sp.]HEX2542657.1 DUF6351 family protein [Caldimonas sp.]